VIAVRAARAGFLMAPLSLRALIVGAQAAEDYGFVRDAKLVSS
jgi:hypothetical protein